MKDPTPETAPFMHAAANESIAAVFEQGCKLEMDLHHSRCAVKRAARQADIAAAERDAAIALLNEVRKQRDALIVAANRLLPFIPDMEPIGAAKHAESNLAAWDFRQLLKDIVK